MSKNEEIKKTYGFTTLTPNELKYEYKNEFCSPVKRYKMSKAELEKYLDDLINRKSNKHQLDFKELIK